MAEFDSKQIREQAKENFTETWISTSRLIPRNTSIKLTGKGKAHPLRELVQKSREILLNLGF